MSTCSCGGSNSSTCKCSSSTSLTYSSYLISTTPKSSTFVGYSNLVSRSVFVDSVFGTACGEFQNPDKPFRTIRQAIRNANKHVTAKNPVTVIVRPGVHISKKVIMLSSNVYIQGSGVDGTLVYGHFAALNSPDPRACNTNFSTAVEALSIVSYFNPAYYHNTDGNVDFRRVKIYQLNTIFGCGDSRAHHNLLTPQCVPNPTPSRPAVVVLRGTFSIDQSNIEMDLGNPVSNTDNPVISVIDNAAVAVTLQRTNCVIQLNNTANGGTNKFVSIFAYTSNLGNMMNLKSINGLHTMEVNDASDTGAILLLTHATNNTSVPKVAFLSTNDRLDLEAITPLLNSPTAPTQAVVQVDDNVASYVNTTNYAFRNNFTVPTVKYLSTDSTSKYASIQTSTNARTFIHHLSVAGQEQAPPSTGGAELLRAQSIGIEAEADFLANGAEYSLIINLPNANVLAATNTYTITAADRVLVVSPTSPALTIILTTPQIMRERQVRIYNKSANVATIQTANGEIILRAGILSTSTLIPLNDAVDFHSTGPSSPYTWIATDLVE